MRIIIFTALFALLSISSQSFALSFAIPSNSNIVGVTKTTTIQEDDALSAIAQKYDVGYYELFEANPNVDPDNPPPSTIMIIPTQYIIPPELKPNTIVINLAEMRLYYQPKLEKRLYVFPLGIGKEDWNTPTGTFKIVAKITNPKWHVPDLIYKFRKSIGDPVEHVVKAGPQNPMGKYALRLSDPTTLIHGTNSPEGIGRRGSSGCIRLYPADIEQLFHMVERGTRVIIINHPYKVGWLDGKLYLEAHMPLLEQRLKWGGDVSLASKLVTAASKNYQAQIDWQKVTQVAQEHLCVPREVGKI